MLPIIIEEKLDSSKMDWLEEVWEMMAYRLRIPNTKGKDIFKLINKRYTEDQRQYHNLSHIYSLLMMVEEFYDFIGDQKLFELSIWFHDLIYDTSRNDNEKKSGEAALRILGDYLQDDFLQQLNYMILSTAKHTPILQNHDNKLFLDLDLAILASEESTYQKYANAIRKEFHIFPDDLYLAGRKMVLEGFLKKEHIYYTEFFQENFEKKARYNIDTELKSFVNI